jgi:hypothetical protein
MSIPEANTAGRDDVATRPGSADPGGQSTAAATVSSAKSQAAELGSEVGGQAKAVAGEAKAQAQMTLDEARTQARNLAGQARQELLGQADSKAGQAAAGLQSVAGQLQAMADGRTAEAGAMAGYAQQAADRVGAVAERLQTGGAQGLVDDVSSFARRRPGLFLLGAVGAGFLVGRLVRSGKAAMDEQDPSSQPALAAPRGDAVVSAPVPFDAPPLPTSAPVGEVLIVPSTSGLP